MEVREAIERFLTSGEIERNLSRATLKAYAGDLRLLASDLSAMEVGDVSIDHLRLFIEHQEGTGLYQDTTIRRRLATIKAFFSSLEEDGLISDSPARRLRGHYGVVRRLPRVMSLGEIRALLRYCRRFVADLGGQNGKYRPLESAEDPLFRAVRNLAIFELLFATGMRVGELSSLNLADVSLQDRTVRILGKGRRERLSFLSSDETVAAMRDYIALRAAVRIGTDALFLNKHGSRLSIYSVENSFRSYLQRAHIRRNYTPHCLRHTMATMLLNNGADIRSVQEILGHRTIATTQIYTEVSIAQKRKTMIRFHERNRMRLNSPLESGQRASSLATSAAC